MLKKNIELDYHKINTKEINFLRKYENVKTFNRFQTYFSKFLMETVKTISKTPVDGIFFSTKLTWRIFKTVNIVRLLKNKISNRTKCYKDFANEQSKLQKVINVGGREKCCPLCDVYGNHGQRWRKSIKEIWELGKSSRFSSTRDIQINSLVQAFNKCTIGVLLSYSI